MVDPEESETGAIFDGLAALHRILEAGLLAILPLWHAFFNHIEDEWTKASDGDLAFHHQQLGILLDVQDDPEQQRRIMEEKVSTAIVRLFICEELDL